MRVEKEFVNIVEEVRIAMILNPFSPRTKEAKNQVNIYIDRMGWSDDEYDVAFDIADRTWLAA